MESRRKYGTYESENSYDVCPECGGPKIKTSGTCRTCYKKRQKSHYPCPSCGKEIWRPAKQCADCYNREREAKKPRCIDCGKDTKRYAHDYAAERCWPCEVTRRRNQPKKPCAVAGCQRPHAAKGLCRNHYSAQYQPRPRGALRGGRPKLLLASWPCQLCGYSRMSSDVHRITPGAEGGRYTVGNMVALCVRCHREVHRGLASAPEPPSEEAIRSFHPSA